MPVALITHPDCTRHDMGQGHPECPARLDAINDQLIASGLDTCLEHYEAPLAEREQLCRVHDPVYVSDIFRRSPREGLVHLDPDTSMNPHTLTAALRAAGAGVLAVDLVMTGTINAAFCSVRPPGHHAERNRAMGFCFFNNVAVAAAHALEVHGLERVAVVDFDVHHGNGTEHIFLEDERVLLCSSFQHPFYPFSGADTRHRHIINTPLSESDTAETLHRIVETQWLPALEAHRPQLILISAGFDAHREDAMSGLNFTDDDYGRVTNRIHDFAMRACSGRIVSMLEGGYALPALGRSAVAHIRTLIDR